MPKLISFSNTDWYLFNYRLPVDKVLREAGWEVIMASPPGEFQDAIQQAGFRWIEVPMSRSGLNPFAEMRTVGLLADIIRREKPDLVHTFTMKGNVNGSLAAWRAGLPRVVNSIAGLGYIFSSDRLLPRLLRPFARLAYRAVLSRGATIFQNNEDMETFTRTGLAPQDRSHLIRSSGVDVDIFQPGAEPSGKIRILFAARLLWTKGIGELVEAARQLRDRQADFEVVVAGEPDTGNPETVNAAQLQSWAEEKLITRVGFQKDMPALMRSCHIVCFPSKHKEGTPRFLVEAASAGLPIVTTDNRGCVEVVEHGVNGLLVPPGDATALAAALLELIQNPEKRLKFGEAGRLIALRDFSVKQVAERTAEVYTTLLKPAP